jgi:hypothetical protein
MVIHRPPFTVHHFASLDSTNDQLKAMVAAPEFTCVAADEQTAGRGRRIRRRATVSIYPSFFYLEAIPFRSFR